MLKQDDFWSDNAPALSARDHYEYDLMTILSLFEKLKTVKLKADTDKIIEAIKPHFKELQKLAKEVFDE